MTKKHKLTIKKSVAIWNRDLSISPKDFFWSLSKTVVSLAIRDGGGTAGNMQDVLASVGIQEQPENAAWLLIYKSLQQSLSELIEEYSDFFTAEIEEPDQLRIATELEIALNTIEVRIDADIFDHPHKLPLLEKMKKPLIQWLTRLGMSKAEASALHLRLKGRFAMALHDQWVKDPQDYDCIEKAINSPFSKATKEQRGWMQYSSWLQEQTNERMFTEAFSLKQVYVPLRAYYKKATNHKVPRVQHVVVDLHTELEIWVRNFDLKHPVRIISGGPGSGKSSFGKMFTAFVAREIEEVPVIFIPLHHFNLTVDLVSGVEQFVKEDRFLTGSPLDASEGKERLLIIFDGLDELYMQGKVAAQTAHSFVDDVISKIDKFNKQGFQRQVLITGRDLAVQAASIKLQKMGQILYALPYYISKKDIYENGDDDNKRYDYVDNDNLLEKDQRDEWWKKYGAAIGRRYMYLPTELSTDRLTPITREPLLNYLVALSYERNKIDFSEQTTLNTFYLDLLHAVHERQWDHGQHKGAEHLRINEFIRVLEEIALAVWHGDGRTATVNKIIKCCKKNNLTQHLKAFQEAAKKGVPRLLTAFYFRQSEHLQGGEKTFEFTHKSFGEYLIARRILWTIKQIHKELLRHDTDPNKGFNECEALKRWVHLCGPTTMDKYIFRFLCDEIATYPDELKEWQKTFARLISWTVKNEMQIEIINISNREERVSQSRNAEESLMVIYYACGIKTEKIVNISWESNIAFGEWIKRLQGQRMDFSENRLILDCLALLNLGKCCLINFDFYQANLSCANLTCANLEGANLEGANLEGANLTCANLSGAILTSADLEDANLEGANLTYADLEDANLEDAILTYADLEGADFTGGRLSGANLTGARLSGANLSGAYLTCANLIGANLIGANLKGAELKGANLTGADLTGADLEDAFLTDANLTDANLEGADLRNADLKNAFLTDAFLTDANLEGAFLEGANLTGANLEDANLKDADLEGAFLKGANLSRADLEDADLEDADLEGANLEDANLRVANLRGTNFESANLEGADLKKVILNSKTKWPNKFTKEKLIQMGAIKS